MKQLSNNYYAEQEDNLFVREHEWYWTPNTFWTKLQLEKNRLDPANSDMAKELARFFYHKVIKEQDYIEDKYKLENTTVERDDMKTQQIVEKTCFYEELWKHYIPGWTPLEKAINCLSILQNQKDEDEKNGKPSPDFYKMDLPQVLKSIPDKEKFEDCTLNTLMKQRKEISSFNKKIDMLKNICMVESFGKTFEIKKSIKEIRVPNSSETKQKKMIEYEDVVRSPLYQRILPNFLPKLITKDLSIVTPIKIEEAKQKIIILVDFSGSMSYEFKQNWVLAILADRLSYCMKEECEIFFSYFLTKNDVGSHFKFTHIYNEITAVDFFKTFNTHPTGGKK